MELSFEQKKKIFELHQEGFGYKEISAKFNVARAYVQYICRLIDRHGLESVYHEYRTYSIEEKETAILRVLEGHESIFSVAIDIGLPSRSSLSSWVKSYKENGYNVVIRKKGRLRSNVREKEDTRGVGEGKRRTSPKSFEAYNRERIYKKIRCLNYRGRKEEKEKTTKVVTELRQELKCSLAFILETINENPSLPNLAKSDYYYWLNRTDPDAKNTKLMEEIKRIFKENKDFGYRRVWLELRKTGWTVNHKTVKRLMSKMNLYAQKKKAKYKSYLGDFNGTVDNVLLYKVVDEKNHKTEYKRNFSTSGVNQKWTTDISEFHIAAGKLYLSPILDMHNNEIISYNISTSPNYKQITDMLNKAFTKFSDLTGLIFHSDQGWQYQMRPYHNALKEHGITQSMSRKGNCLDNSPMESFFGRMKTEMFYGHEYEFETLEDLKTAMDEYIDYYNNRRLQPKLKGLTPCEFRSQSVYSI